MSRDSSQANSKAPLLPAAQLLLLISAASLLGAQPPDQQAPAGSATLSVAAGVVSPSTVFAGYGMPKVATGPGGFAQGALDYHIQTGQSIGLVLRAQTAHVGITEHSYRWSTGLFSEYSLLGAYSVHRPGAKLKTVFSLRGGISTHTGGESADFFRSMEAISMVGETGVAFFPAGMASSGRQAGFTLDLNVTGIRSEALHSYVEKGANTRLLAGFRVNF